MAIFKHVSCKLSHEPALNPMGRDNAGKHYHPKSETVHIFDQSSQVYVRIPFWSGRDKDILGVEASLLHSSRNSSRGTTKAEKSLFPLADFHEKGP